MQAQHSFFDNLANAIISSLTYVINSYSGVLQVLIYSMIFGTFCFALLKCFQALRVLVFCDLQKFMQKPGTFDFHTNIGTPLAIVSASFFLKTKKHYVAEKANPENSGRVIPPDAFIRDAAYQFSERYFEEKFFEPIAMLANLLPPLGFIGTIIGMVVHFLANSGTLNTEVTVAGIATALYTTFIGLLCYTVLEFMKKVFYALALRRIDEGLSLVSKSFPAAGGTVSGVKGNEA